MWGAAQSYRATHHEHEPSGNLSLAYRITDRNLVYATYSRGVRNGGINLVSLNLSQGAKADVKPELNDMFEFGTKNTLLHGRLFLNASAFWNNVHDYITSASYYTPTNSIISYLTNAKHAISRGFEVDARGVILPGLEGRLSAAYTDAYYASFRNASQPLESSNIKALYNLSGNQLPLNSKWNLSAGLDYTVPFKTISPSIGRWGDDLLFYVGGDYTYRTSYYADPSESAYTKIRPYGLLDAHIGVRPQSGKWDVSFWGHNILDKRYFVTMSAQGSGSLFYGQPGDPAMFGGEFNYHL
jgi:iron complex outermembrane receptor protein